MKTVLSYACFLAVTLLGLDPISADELPAKIESAASQAAPMIDGVIHKDEWTHATAITFDMKMVQPGKSKIISRVCELRVMNSANALYLALRSSGYDGQQQSEPDEHRLRVSRLLSRQAVAGRR